MAKSKRTSGAKPGTKLIASNRAARHNYSIDDTLEAGIVLLGSEVKSMRESQVQVADGYATNFLIPNGVAVPAAGGAYRAWQHDIASREDKRQRERADAEIAATRIGSTTLTLGVKVGEGGKLYGSITSKDIADALARRGIDVDRHKIDLEEPLKSLGTYKVAVKVYAGMTPEVTIVVEPKG